MQLSNFQTYKDLQKCSSAWYCLKCYEKSIPFTAISNKEPYQTNQGQKIKNKVHSYYKIGFSSQDLIDQLNDAMDDIMTENISTKYYEPYELTPLMKNTTNNVFLSFKYIFPLLSHGGTHHSCI